MTRTRQQLPSSTWIRKAFSFALCLWQTSSWQGCLNMLWKSCWPECSVSAEPSLCEWQAVHCTAHTLNAGEDPIVRQITHYSSYQHDTKDEYKIKSLRLMSRESILQLTNPGNYRHNSCHIISCSLMSLGSPDQQHCIASFAIEHRLWRFNWRLTQTQSRHGWFTVLQN